MMDSETEIDVTEDEDKAMMAVKMATKIINDFVEICTADQVGQIEGVRYWLEVYGVGNKQAMSEGIKSMLEVKQ